MAGGKCHLDTGARISSPIPARRNRGCGPCGLIVKQHGRFYVAKGAWLARVMMVLPFPAMLSTNPSVPPCVIVEGCAAVDYA